MKRWLIRLACLVFLFVELWALLILWVLFDAFGQALHAVVTWVTGG